MWNDIAGANMTMHHLIAQGELIAAGGALPPEEPTLWQRLCATCKRLSDEYPHRWWWPFLNIYGGPSQATCYMTRVYLTPSMYWGRLFLHIFHREDLDRDPHDHPFSFWTMPINQHYVEEVYDPVLMCFTTQTVPRLRWSYRPAAHAHRIISCPKGWPLVTVVWHAEHSQPWGFWCHSNSTACGDDYNSKGECIASRERYKIPFEQYTWQGQGTRWDNVEGVDVTCPGVPAAPREEPPCRYCINDECTGACLNGHGSTGQST